MNKRFLLLGVVTIGLLLLSGLPSTVAQEPETETDPFSNLNGVVDLTYDLSLTNIWNVGPTTGSDPSDLTNTNLRYNLTSMKSPLNEYFNVGAFTFESPDSEPQPEFMIDGTFEGSELFVKIVNDQLSVVDSNNRMLDWQATLTLKDAINMNVSIPAEADLGGFPIDLMPTGVTIPAGSGIPPLPVIQSTTNFSYFGDLGNLAKSYGYDGLPFVSPAIYYIEDLADANDFWTNINVSDMFGTVEDPNDNRTIDLTTIHDGEGFELTIDVVFFNTTMTFGNVSISAHWDLAGWLDHFEACAFADLDQSYSLDPAEEFSVVFDLLGTEQAPLPISVGDKGEYIMNMYFAATVDLDNDTEESFVQSLLDEISASINELDGEALLNYSVDSIDGLYYHIDGYLLDLPKFMADRLPFLGDSGTAAQEPLPIDAYYMPIAGMDKERSGFALNLFDAGVYRNVTNFFEIYDGHYYFDEYYGYDMWSPLQAQDENTTIIDRYMPGIVNAKIYNKSGWNYNLSIEENFAALTEIYNGPVEYTQINNTWYEQIWNGTHYEMVLMWDTYEVVQIKDPSKPFTTGVDYIAVLEIEFLPNSGFTSYHTMTSPYMMMFGDNNNDPEPQYSGFAAQDDTAEAPSSFFGIEGIPDPQSFLPLPARTPDWAQVGGPIVLLEGYVMQAADVITSPDFIAFLEEMAA